ncbi:MAG: UbiD family decarboxylase [Dehalococcoidales bacterium]|nr:UbiD family decarboxylase [Dehalococcoidales bacterium]
MLDLRDWLEKSESVGGVRVIKGLHWDMEIAIAANRRLMGDDPRAYLFDDIVGYPGGYRVLSGATKTAQQAALCLGIPETATRKVIEATRKKLPEWEAAARQSKFDPKVVQTGPILENIDSGKDVDLFKFPTPKWHELDGGRYIGTTCAVITQDPDNGEVNLGTYRIVVHDEKTVGLYISPGHHGRIHYEKYHAQGKACPVAITVGQHPLISNIASVPVSFGNEYNIMGAISGEPVNVIKEEITGLPIPANSEIVIAGWCPPDKMRDEGPFGEWTGYYAAMGPAPFVEVERVYYRTNPIMTGSGAGAGAGQNIVPGIMMSSMVFNGLENAGVPDVRGAWISNFAGQMWVVVSIKQRYAGHSRQAGYVASQGTPASAYHGRYVIVVDEDIDPTDIRQVLWAVATRSDPETDIEIIRGAWSTPLDPTIQRPTNRFVNSRAIIDACRPYEWINEFPKVVDVTNLELVEKVKEKVNKSE